MTALPAGLDGAPDHPFQASAPNPDAATAPPGRMGAFDLAVFATPSLPISALGLPLAVYLPEFFANVVGIRLQMVGLMFLVIRLLDLTVDPVLGGVMDRTRTRHGRFRPWLAAGAPLCMAAAYMTFMAPPGEPWFLVAVWLLVLYLSYSILLLSHTAWASTLASAYHERSRVYGFSQVGLVLAMVVVPALAAAASAGRGHEPGAGVHAIGWFIILLAPLTVGLTCLRVREAPPPPRDIKRPRLSDYLRLIRRPAVARILLADLFLAFAPGVTAALFFFFFREARGFTTPQANLLLVTYFVGALVGGSLWTLLARRIGKHQTLTAAALYYAVVQVLIVATPKGAFLPEAVAIFLGGLAYSAPTIFIRSMLADASDEAELADGKNSTGLLYALISSTAKIASSMAIFISFSVLGWVGFVSKAHAANTPAAIQGLILLFILLPSASAVCGALVLRRYPLDQARHKEIMGALETRRGAGL